MRKIEHPQVQKRFQSYPDHIRKRLLFLRGLIIETASAIDDVGELEETVKWGEPSYVSRIGSTIRIDWKEKQPDQYAMYFNCQTKLVDTFKELYRNVFTFEGNRAIVFHDDESIAVEELRQCITLSLRYRKIKHHPMLGM